MCELADGGTMPLEQGEVRCSWTRGLIQSKPRAGGRSTVHEAAVHCVLQPRAGIRIHLVCHTKTPLTMNTDTRSSPLNDIDFDALKHQMHNAPGFPHFCIDNFLEASFANQVHDAFPAYSEAEKMGKTFDAVNEKKKTQITDSRLFPPPILRLHEVLASDEFVAKMSYMSGIPDLQADPGLSGGGIHETNHGGRLDVHVDFNFNDELGLYRRLNVLIYFNKDWQEAYGGYLDLWDKDVLTCLGRFAPSFNRAAGFATSHISWHGVTPVNCPPGEMRKSFAVYYYSKEPAPGWDGVKRSTVFRARPDEYWKGGVAMPAENIVRATRRTVRSVKQKMKDLLSR
jgi:Rps23 Pro-64 3,4-dihydroxylase Tpa1-like proline 4-hydroxylase